jgi:hypothetical protein
MQKTQQKCTEDRILHQTYKKGPHGKAHRRSKVANRQYLEEDPPISQQLEGGAKVGHQGVGGPPRSAEPSLAPVQVHLGGKINIILLKSVCHVFKYNSAREPPLESIKGEEEPSHKTHHKRR